jgi:hypothetical protein
VQEEVWYPDLRQSVKLVETRAEQLLSLLQ